MSRGRTLAQTNADTARHSGSAVLLELLFTSGTLRLCIGPWSVEFEGNTYTATAAAMSVDTHQEVVDGAEGLAFTLSGLAAGIFDLVVSEPYNGRIVRMMELRFDADDQPVGSPTVEFIGRMTGLTSTEQPGSRTHTVRLTAEHYDADSARARDIRFSDAEQRRRYPDDKGFEYVTSMVERTLTRD